MTPERSIATRTRRDAYAELTPDSSFSQLVEVWLEDLDLEGKLAPNTRALCERNMRLLALEPSRGRPARRLWERRATCHEQRVRAAARLLHGLRCVVVRIRALQWAESER